MNSIHNSIAQSVHCHLLMQRIFSLNLNSDFYVSCSYGALFATLSPSNFVSFYSFGASIKFTQHFITEFESKTIGDVGLLKKNCSFCSCHVLLCIYGLLHWNNLCPRSIFGFSWTSLGLLSGEGNRKQFFW